VVAVGQPAASLSGSGAMTVSKVFTNGVCTFERADSVLGPWHPLKNVFTTSGTAQANLPVVGTAGFYRAAAWDLSGGQAGFDSLTRVYGRLSTIAGAGSTGLNNWEPQFEGGPATEAPLSGPHIAMADRAGEVFIADKDAHAIRKIRLDGTIVTVAGINEAGNGPDAPTPGTQAALNGPNGLWVRGDGTVFILDTGNGKVRRLGADAMMRTLFTVPGGILAGRGLWVSDDEQVAYVASLVVIKKWTAEQGVTDFATGFTQLGNLTMDPWGNLVVTDRSAHRVYRLDSGGNPTVIAGSGATYGGGDGQLALATGLEEVRGVWFLPTGAYFLATHRGSQVWYVDTAGYIYLFLNGWRNETHAGDGTWFYNPAEFRVSECRAVTVDYEGNVLITENDMGYVRKVQFVPWTP
jgi:hypothetical protein